MRKLFLEGGKLQYNLDVEAALAQAEADVVLFASDYADEIRSKANIDYVTPEDVWKLEQEIHHDVMAMVLLLTKACQGGAGDYVHLGATSYDIEDNRLALQMNAASYLVLEKLKQYGRYLLEKADEYKGLAAVGRSHGQWAEPITVGHKFARYAYDASIDVQLWLDFLDKYLVGKPMTGAVGTSDSYVQLTDPDKACEIGEAAMKYLKLRPALITDQAITRKMHALAGSNMMQTASSLTRFAWELWHLQRPEIGEMWERDYTKGKFVGSTAMPHKRNPINSENIIALSRVINRLAGTGYDNIPLLHETELTKSGSERIWIPTCYLLLDEILSKGGFLANDSVVRTENVGRNLRKATPLTASEPIMMELTKRGVGRQDAHHILRDEYAQRLYEEPDLDPFDVLESISEVAERLSRDDIKRIFEKHEEYTGNSERYVEDVIEETSPIFS